MSELNDAGDPATEPQRAPAAIPPEVNARGPGAEPTPNLTSGAVPERPRSSMLPALAAVALVILLAAVVWLWQRGEALQTQVTALQASLAAMPTDASSRLASMESTLGDLRKQVESLAAQKQTPPADLHAIEARLDTLEHRPAPKAADLAPLEQRLAALEHRPPPAPVNLAPLEQRLAALEHRPPPPPVNLAPLEQQLAAVQQRPTATPSELHALDERLATLEHRPPPPPVDLAPLEQRIAALEKRPVNPPMDPALLARVAGLAAAQKTTEQQAQAATAAAHSSADRTARVQRLQQAAVDLAAGKPLGDMAGASSALARFAKVAPPTEAELRLSFPQAARAAASASEPSSGGLSFTQRMWQRAQELVTVREGGHVIIGAPAAATLAAARAKLEAGDLAGAVATLDALDATAARAMQPWRDQAQALLDARAALATAAAG